MNIEKIPQELKQRNQWVLWKLEQRSEGGKPTKVPYQAIGKKASTTNPASWTSFQNALTIYLNQPGAYCGLGYVFSADDPFTGIDLDDCIVDGTLTGEASKTVSDLNSYTELSQSRSSVHVIVKAKLPGKKNRTGKYEMYDQNRYFAITGDHFTGTPETIEERQQEVNTLYERLFGIGNIPKKPPFVEDISSNQTVEMDDQDIINIAARAKNGEKFASLYYQGDWHPYYKSQSEADQALCNLLAFYTKNPEQIDRLFRSSALSRQKWERDDYRDMTIRNALECVKAQYKVKTTEDEWSSLVEALGEYAINDTGHLCCKKYDKNGGIMLKPLSNFVARITRQISTDNGLEKHLQYEIEGVLADGRPLPAILVPANKFGTMAWVTDSWGVLPNIRPGTLIKDQVRYVIQGISSHAAEEQIFSHLGWRKIDGKWAYLHAGGAVGAEGVKVNVQQEGLQRYKLPEYTENLEEAIAATLRSLEVADKAVTYPLLAMVGLAPLCEPLRKAGAEPSFILWLLGESGARKSSIVALFLNHFGTFANGKELPAGFKDTSNALEKKAFTTKDSLLVVDDYHPKATIHEARQMEQLAQQLLRGYGDHQARTRMASDGTTLRLQYKPRGCCIVTGEDKPKAGTSTTARFLTVTVDRGSVNLDKLSEAQDESGKLSHSGRGYLEWLAPKIEELPQKLRDEFRTIRILSMRSDQHGRIPETVAHLYIGFKMFTAYAEEKGLLAQEERENMLNDAFQLFLNLASQHNDGMFEETPVNMFLTAINELIATGKAFLIKQHSTAESSSGELIGYEDNRHFLLIPETTMNMVTQFYQKQNRNFPLTKDALIKQLDTEGLIYTTTEKNTDGSLRKRRTPKKKIGNKSMNMLWLKKTALEQKGEKER
ncbi:DUF927 domain-containing protein [Thermicanus aegyptius]|uniref:phage NrS-1 polymerase family protein n=1 Tax=Thermicanus aegyptius TaxID=94009 RepID=UPI0003FE3AFC|nr:DUF927 domain-containing protein [Thermicanus aegyptius]